MKIHGVAPQKSGPGVARARQGEDLPGVLGCSRQGLQHHTPHGRSTVSPAEPVLLPAPAELLSGDGCGRAMVLASPKDSLGRSYGWPFSCCPCWGSGVLS